MNRYDRKYKTRRKLKNLYDQGCYFVCVKETEDGKHYYKRDYLSGSRKFAKRQTKRKVRRSGKLLRNNLYRKTFDYWWTVL